MVFRNTNPNRFGRFTIKEDTVYPRVLAQISRVIQRGDFDPNGKLYALARDPLAIVTIDTATGVITDVAAISGLVDTNHGCTGLSYNSKTDSWYAMSDDLNTCCTQLYSVNIVTGEFTPIGGAPGPSQLAWLETDTNGIAYSDDAYSDSLYTIDLNTGIATGIGPLGYDMYNVRHGASIDPATNDLYVLSSTVTNSTISPISPDLFLVDKNTGQATSLIGKYSSIQYGLLAIAPEGGGSNGIETQSMWDAVISPNPGDGQFVVRYSNHSRVRWEIYDYNGKLIKKGMDRTGRIDINLSHYPNDIYLFKLQEAKKFNNFNNLKIVKTN